jgi:hypothetical protein
MRIPGFLFKGANLPGARRGEGVTVQSRVAGRYGLRSGVKAKRFPGLGVRAVRLEP